MTTRNADLDVCPRSKCNHPIIDSFVTRDPFQIKHQNAIQYKTCVVPDVDDDGPYVYVVFHDQPETEFTPASDLEQDIADDAPEAVVEAEAEPEADADLSALTQFEQQIYHFVDRRDGSAMLAEIAGKMVGSGKDREAVDAAVERLVADGYFDEIENGVYRT